MDSPIANPGTLFQYENEVYDGAQGFRLPRDDLYNITVAGASGGEGVCNYHYGLGGVISAQVRLTTDYEYLIMVGQKGTSVCDVPENAGHPVCQQLRPTNLTEAQACNDTWYSWTKINAGEDLQYNQYNFNGGGGGGGASMIWPRRVDNREFTDLPIVISPGGGGASAVLDYEFAARRIVQPRYNLSYELSADHDQVYTFHANGHFNRYSISWPEGASGYRLSGAYTEITSGVGSGWISSPIGLASVDGKLLSQGESFAEGGFDCSSVFQDPQYDGLVFTNVFGGYGGGGGGCASGGGGGGYSGGSVLTNFYRMPGGGGDAGVFNLTELSLVRMLNKLGFNDGDGYVEIVASNCGCAGECVVYTEERQFECKYLNSTEIRGNGSYQGEQYVIVITQAQVPHGRYWHCK